MINITSKNSHYFFYILLIVCVFITAIYTHAFYKFYRAQVLFIFDNNTNQWRLKKNINQLLWLHFY